MMNQSEAEKLAQKALEGSTITEVEDFGDIYAIHFVNDEYQKSQNIEDMAVGAGPMICIKGSGEIFRTGSGLNSEQYVLAYRECGDIYGNLSAAIEIQKLPQEIDNAHCILSLKKIVGVNLSESKKIVK